MSFPLNKESLAQLKAFVDFCSQKPDILHDPQLHFFKAYLESIGATIPKPTRKPAEQTVPDKEPEVEVVMEEVESEPESDLELNTEGCIEPDPENANQEMGDADKTEVPEEESDKADEKRIEAMSQFSEGNFEKAVELFSEAIMLNPNSSVAFVKRGQAYLKLNKPNACIKDCTRALALNPDSCAGFKFRGRAHRLLGNWENAAKDLRQACLIDFDEQADEWLKEVTPNAVRIEQHRIKQERKKIEKEQRERAERLRKARDAHAKAAEADTHTEGAPSGPGGGAGMSDFYKILQDPEFMAALQDPEVASAFQDISTNPSNFVKYQSNPKIMSLIAKLSSKFQSSGMGFPGFPGSGGFPGGFPGAGGFSAANAAQPPADDGLD